MLNKLMWLIAGVVCGVGLSSTFAKEAKTTSVDFKVFAVSLEDAQELAIENFKSESFTSNLSVDWSQVVAVQRVKCTDTTKDAEAYQCRATLVHSI